jgi:negative regulator of replication initiation
MKRFLVLEALDDEASPNSTPADDAATAGKTGAAATDEPTDTPGFAGADGQDEPGDETASPSLDGDQPADENDLEGDGDDADPLANVDPNEPVELPDLDNLQTDRLQTLENEQEVADTKSEKYDSALGSAMDDLDVLNAATESLRQALASDQEISTEDLKGRIALLNGIRRRQRYSRYVISVEHLTPQVALENFMSTLRSLFQAIIKAISRAIEWLKERVRKFFSETKWSSETTQRLTEEVLHTRKTHASAFRLMIQRQDFRKDNYVSAMGAKPWLTNLGKQPGAGMRINHYDPRTGNLTGTLEPTYGNCFEDLANLATLHQFYASKTFLRFTELIPAIATAIDAEQPYPEEIMGVDIDASIPTRSRPLLHYEGRTSEDGCRLYVSDGYLGSLALTVEMPYQADDGTPRNRLVNIGQWKVDFVKAQPDLPNGDLRYLSDQEIVEGSRMSQELSEELARQRRTFDLVEDYSEELKKLMENLQNKVDQLTADSEDYDKAQQYLELLKASNAIVRNASNVLGSGADYCHKVQLAWIVYLTEIRAADKALIGAAKTL